MKNYFFVFIVIFLPFSTNAVADSKGLRFGASASYSLLNGYAEEGPAGQIEAIRAGLAHTRPLDKNNARLRWWLNLNYMNDAVNAPSGGGIYQEVQNIEFRAIPQYAFPVTSWWTPYVGAGGSVGYSRFSERWHVDSDGYKYGDQLPDSEAFEAAMLFNAGMAFKLGSNPNAHIQVVPQLFYIIPLTNGFSGVEFNISILF